MDELGKAPKLGDKVTTCYRALSLMGIAIFRPRNNTLFRGLEAQVNEAQTSVFIFSRQSSYEGIAGVNDKKYAALYFLHPSGGYIEKAKYQQGCQGQYGQIQP